MTASPRIHLGYVSGVYGVQGWIKIFSYTAPRDKILVYPLWLLGSDQRLQRYSVENGRWQGKSIVVKLAGINTCDEAGQVVGRGIYIERSELPKLAGNEFYWADLVGLNVFTEDGDRLGIVDGVMETGANDVLVVRGDRERLIPFVRKQIVKSVDIERGRLVVAWDPDF